MRKYLTPFLILFLLHCKEVSKKDLTAQQIVDRAIANSGGLKYKDSRTSFMFRNRLYESKNSDGKRILMRTTFLDSVTIADIKSNESFQRYINDTLVNIPDSVASRYSNAVNSVHYFARLPYGLNDAAVNKTFLGTESIKDQDFYKVKVTFDQMGGGKDFEDTYVYWFDKETFKPIYLAYDFHTDGGGQRFRKAYNERYINGIRFVDYENYKPKKLDGDILDIAKKFNNGELELLSKIELKKVTASKN